MLWICENVEICYKTEPVSVSFAHIEYLWVILHIMELWRFVAHL